MGVEIQQHKASAWKRYFRSSEQKAWSSYSYSHSRSEDGEYSLQDVKKSKQSSFWPPRFPSRPLKGPEPTTTPPGWWQNQMLFDRSLRGMAALTSLYAVIMVIICAVELKPLLRRSNRSSTSVGLGKDKTCQDLKGAEIFVQLVINVAATTILGMSNTYQQLVTSLNTHELRWSLSKFGDCRVGTNSPTTINRKQHGKLKGWLAWLLLICTSLPMHFFANSIVGPSIYRNPPKDIQFNPVTEISSTQSSAGDWSSFAETSSACWILFRTGKFQDWASVPGGIGSIRDMFAYSTLRVNYTAPGCENFARTADIKSILDAPGQEGLYGVDQSVGNCSTRAGNVNVVCEASGANDKRCRLSIRMSAAIILAICLLVKACYMIIVNLQGRMHKKTQCLTFGDAIIACVMDRDLSIQNECMVNAGEAYRHSTSHTCHKHCTSKEKSESGDELGHCQKCQKFNQIDKAADLQHPCIATKYKKSLLTNLGSAALVQMLILMFTSLAMAGGSIYLLIGCIIVVREFNTSCNGAKNGQNFYTSVYSPEVCKLGVQKYLVQIFGGFGGFGSHASLGELPPNRALSEILAFAISNGAQLLYSLLYLLLIYNLTLISMEYDWGQFEKERLKPRCTLVRGPGFRQSYLLQLPKKVIYPLMFFSSLMHWLLGQAISTTEVIWAYHDPSHKYSWETSEYQVVYGAYSLWVATICMIAMTATCWWAFTFTREGFIPQMYGSIRVCCASTTNLIHNADNGIKWGDLGRKGPFRHAGFSVDKVGAIVPAALYTGSNKSDKKWK